MADQPASAETKRIRLAVQAVTGSLLDQWLDQQHAAKLARDEAAERVKSLTARIKAELTLAHPGVALFDIPGSPYRPPLSLIWGQRISLDTERMKRENPWLYTEYANITYGWTLRPAGRGGRQ